MLPPHPTPAHLDPAEEVDVAEPSEELSRAYAEEAVTFTSVLDLPRRVVAHVAVLHEQHVTAQRTRPGRRAVSSWEQSVAFCRVMLEDVEPDQIALDTGIARSPAHLRMGESEQIVAAHTPALPDAVAAAREAGHRHLNLDGTLIGTDRVAIPGPTTRKTPRRPVPSASRSTGGTSRPKGGGGWSGKHFCHGGNVQALTGPDGWPLWGSAVRPGREHDVTAARADPELLATLDRWREEGRSVLGDLGYEGEREHLLVPVKADANGTDRRGELKPLTDDQATLNALHSATRARAEADNALLKQTFKVLRHVRVDPWRIGTMTAAALVLLHLVYDRAT